MRATLAKADPPVPLPFSLTFYGKFAIFRVMTRRPNMATRATSGVGIDASWNGPPSISTPVVCVGSSKDDISALPAPVKVPFGHRLREAPAGRMPLDTKPLPQIGTGVLELRERFDGNAYRLMYVVALRHAVYVLHAFIKKSTSGIGMPKREIELIEARLRRARVLDAEDKT